MKYILKHKFFFLLLIAIASINTGYSWESKSVKNEVAPTTAMSQQEVQESLERIKSHEDGLTIMEIKRFEFQFKGSQIVLDAIASMLAKENDAE